MTTSAILVFDTGGRDAAAIAPILGVAADISALALPLLPDDGVDWSRTRALARTGMAWAGACLVLLLPERAGATAHERQATAAALRSLAADLAPGLRVNAIGRGDEPAIRAAAGLIVAAPTMTGQILWLGQPASHRTIATAALARPAPAPRAGLRRMFIRDLELACRIGVYRHEKTGDQRIRVNLELGVRDDPPVADRLDEVVCYDQIATRVRAAVTAGHVNLVETLAERVAQVCLADPRVAVARVRIEKLDIFPDAAGAGVEIERISQKP